MQFKQQLNTFMPSHQPKVAPSQRRFILVHQDKLALIDGEFAFDEKLVSRFTKVNRTIVIGHYQEYEYHLAVVESLIENQMVEIENHMVEWTGLRALMPTINDIDYSLAASALQLKHWQDKHQFCGCCGTKLTLRNDERSMECEQCGNREYPKVHPCVIVRVIKGKDILLCRSPHFKPGLYSNVAGFIEPGESAEKAVYREVLEETGIEIQNIRYLGSQSWPFPSQMMLAFEAEYKSGDICVDGVEVEDAKWWSLEELPQLPISASISGWLIHSYIEANQIEVNQIKTNQ